MTVPTAPVARRSTRPGGLDRLRWAARFSVEAFGVRVGVRVDDAALVTHVRAHLPPGCRPLRSQQVDHLYSIRSHRNGREPHLRASIRVDGGSERLVDTADAAHAFAVFETRVRFDVAMSAKRWVFVHAGAVGWKGRAILIPGPSGHGKSRLVEALVRAGATYYSDEFAVIDRQGHVHPFAKPISLRDDRGGFRSAPVEAVGGAIGTEALPAGLIALARYQPEAVWQPRSVSPGEALMAMLPQTARAAGSARRVLQTLARLVEGAACVRGRRGEAGELAPELLRMLDAETKPRPG